MKRYSYFFLALFLNTLPCLAQSSHPRLLFGSSDLTGCGIKLLQALPFYNHITTT